ncbi:hypothetical protein VRK_41550 [Vibrio sp. MEBiC08052]|nr:hypothetical protein VRK_41550 [Vibrio sp. MEBiC08052]
MNVLLVKIPSSTVVGILVNARCFIFLFIVPTLVDSFDTIS